MTVEDLTMLAGVYLTGAVIISLLAAFRWDLGLKTRLPANRPYVWGFFFGWICILACVPLAGLSGFEMVAAGLRGKWAAYNVHGIYTLLFALNAVCGWLIIRRKGWAWALGTFLGPICAFPVLRDLFGPVLVHVGLPGYIIWLVNYVYGRNRWAEFHNQASAPAPAATEVFESEAPEYSPLLPAWRGTQTNGDTDQEARAAAALVLTNAVAETQIVYTQKATL